MLETQTRRREAATLVLNMLVLDHDGTIDEAGDDLPEMVLSQGSALWERLAERASLTCAVFGLLVSLDELDGLDLDTDGVTVVYDSAYARRYEPSLAFVIRIGDLVDQLMELLGMAASGPATQGECGDDCDGDCHYWYQEFVDTGAWQPTAPTLWGGDRW